MLSSDRRSHRQVFLDAWHKEQRGQPLTPLDQQILEILHQHPEYQPLLARPETALAQEFTPELGQENPFLHMGLHLAIREQISIDQPHGIRARYQKLLRRRRDPHQTEHQMMECLAEALWLLQRTVQPFSEADYFACIQRQIQQ
jgi:hypothetical protein